MHSPPRCPTVRRIGMWINREIAALYPGCFALVMATGIISNALFLEGHSAWSDALFAVNLVAYPSLVVLTGLRFAQQAQRRFLNPACATKSRSRRLRPRERMSQERPPFPAV